MTIRCAASRVTLALLALSLPLTACVAPATSADGALEQSYSAIVGGTPVNGNTFGSVMLWQCSGGAASCSCTSGAASCSV